MKAEIPSMDKRTEYVEKLSAQMVEWDVQIDILKDKAENATPPEKYEYAKLIAALQLKRDQAAIELQGISVASDDQWEELKAGIEHLWHETQKILRDAIAKTR
jgi:hypothetical protein